MKWLILFVLSVAGLETMAQTEPFRPSYVNHTEAGLLLGRVRYSNGSIQNKVESKTNVTMQTFNGLQIKRRLAIGVTAGLDWYKTALINPLSAGVRYDFAGKRQVRLFATGDAGYGFAWFHQDSDGYKTRGGLIINPGAGIRYGRAGGTAFTIVLSYKRQEVHVNKPLLWEQTVRYEDRVYNRLAVRMGISF
ncbi:hypothetical protein DYBT9275_05034 [Dyadobacter sp. CECT 9275]|uniref:Outer membrane protein beta-barrel domain-containing protein n=1 Tax=Dyadobacter helix TaxID=2822344 RepID=A0A916JFI4_9BACT|nr:hypothetical protein [Dyadobacter sp. CECT 9275]CAG5011828.1 hypothetical protein DYBT9275_05034 [Dyadobacter sp. CECT 9275]